MDSGRCWRCIALIPACRDRGRRDALPLGRVASENTVGATNTVPTIRR